MQFKDVIAQDELKAQLIKGATTEKVSQANLFLGVEGTGTLAMALAYAQFLNCENRTATDSCGECNACKKSSKYMHPDVFFTYPTVKAGALSREYIQEWRQALTQNPYMNYTEWVSILDSANKQGNITAKECDQIIKQHSLKHFEGKYKIQIIWGAEFLKKEGNKLLKIIEEPPANTVFLLIAENIEDILVTILSRTQVVKFQRLNSKNISEHLEKRIRIAPEKARKIAQLVEGNWNAAKQLALSNEENNFEDLHTWFSILLQRNKDLSAIQNLVAWVDKMGSSGRENQKIFLKHCLFFLRECLIYNTGLASKLNEEEKDLAKDVIKRVSLEDISKIVSLLDALYYEISRNASAKIGLMNASLEIASFFNSK